MSSVENGAHWEVDQEQSNRAKLWELLLYSCNMGGATVVPVENLHRAVHLTCFDLTGGGGRRFSFEEM